MFKFRSFELGRFWHAQSRSRYSQQSQMPVSGKACVFEIEGFFFSQGYVCFKSIPPPGSGEAELL